MTDEEKLEKNSCIMVELEFRGYHRRFDGMMDTVANGCKTAMDLKENLSDAKYMFGL